jgi:heme-degrading monooxygenase HmoA
MIIQVVKFKSGLSEADVQRTIEERIPQYTALPGLLQKYYVKDNQTGEFGGIYVWDSEESLRKFRESELGHTTRTAYKVIGQARTETFQVMRPLRS